MKYEYKIVNGAFTSELEEELNKLGKKGWEAVCFTEDPSADFGRYKALLKREIN